MIRVALILPLLAVLPACSLFDDSDPREGTETVEQCTARLASERRDQSFDRIASGAALVVPTYTYDVTKVDLDGLQSLIVTGSDETAGSRGMAATNETSTAVAQFMAQSVDENGAFFLGRDPALYRVRGTPVSADEVVSSGCARQLPGMRLITMSVVAAGSQSSAVSTQNEKNS